MTDDRIGFTVVVPTRERGDVLPHALRTITAQTYPDLDILISDNCSTDDTAAVSAAAMAADPRVRYVNTGARLSMSKNWEFALARVPEDRFLMVIGDDDGLVPGALDALAALIRQTKAEAVSAEFATFIWPNADNAGLGRLLVPMRSGHEERSGPAWLNRAIGGRAWYSELPLPYTSGAVRMSLIAKLRERAGGTFFGSCQPDIFSAVTLAATVERYVHSWRPFAIAGHSKHSNGAAWTTSTQGNVSGARPNDLFNSEPNIPWHGDLPVLANGRLPLSIDLLVYESYLQARHLHGDALGIDHQRELAQLIASRVNDRAAMAGWLDDFVARHRLDRGAAERAARPIRRRLARHRLVAAARALRDIYRVEPGAGPAMRNVHDASLVAGAILATRPSLVASQRRTIAKQLRRRLDR